MSRQPIKPHTKVPSVCYSVALIATWGCSVINSPDELLESAGASNGTGGETSMGGMTGSGGSDPAPVEAPTEGLIAVAAEDEDGERVLVTLAARGGAELDREVLPVAAMAYDEAPGRYLWYVFTTPTKELGPNTLAELQIRRFDDDSGEWQVLSRTSALPPPQPGHRPVVLNERLAYLSQAVVMGTPSPAMTVLDTSDVDEVSILDTRSNMMNENQVGLVGRRGTVLDSSAPGGAVSILFQAGCEVQCRLLALPINVTSMLSPGVPAEFSAVEGRPAFVSAPVESEAYALVFDPTAGVSGRVDWWTFDPANPADASAPATVNAVSETEFGGLDVLECENAGMLTEANGNTARGLNLVTATQSPTALDFAGQMIVAEPFEGSAITFRDVPVEGESSVVSFEVERSSNTISLAKRSAWAAPDDIDPFFLATRRPEGSSCE